MNGDGLIIRECDKPKKERKIIYGKIPSRGKGKVHSDITLKTLYKDYKESIGNPANKSTNSYEKKLDISARLFLDITSEYLKLIMHKILTKAETYQLPFGNGTLRVKKKKMNIHVLSTRGYLQPDYEEYHKNPNREKKIVHLNEHTDYCKYSFKWERGKHLKGIFNGYVFQACRKNKRSLGEAIKKYKLDYWE